MPADAFGDRRASSLLRRSPSSLGVALENARLFDETQAAPDRDRRAGRRAGDHQRGPARPRRAARHAGDVRPRRRQDPGDLRRPGRRHRDRRPRGRSSPLPVHDRARRPLPGRADGDPSGRASTSSRPASRWSSTSGASERATEMGQASPVLSGRASAVGRLRAARRRRRGPRRDLAPEPRPRARASATPTSGS